MAPSLGVEHAACVSGSSCCCELSDVSLAAAACSDCSCLSELSLDADAAALLDDSDDGEGEGEPRNPACVVVTPHITTLLMQPAEMETTLTRQSPQQKRGPQHKAAGERGASFPALLLLLLLASSFLFLVPVSVSGLAAWSNCAGRSSSGPGSYSDGALGFAQYAVGGLPGSSPTSGVLSATGIASSLAGVSFTVNIWINRGVQSTAQCAWTVGPNGASTATTLNHLSLCFTTGNLGQVGYNYARSGTSSTLSATTATPDLNGWHMWTVVLSYGASSSTRSLYRDGSLMATDSVAATYALVSTTTGQVTVAYEATTTTAAGVKFMPGFVDDFRIYSGRTMAVGEVSLWATTGYTPSQQGVILWWPFDEQAGTNVTDDSGNGVVGTFWSNSVAASAPWWAGNTTQPRCGGIPRSVQLLPTTGSNAAPFCAYTGSTMVLAPTVLDWSGAVQTDFVGGGGWTTAIAGGPTPASSSSGTFTNGVGAAISFSSSSAGTFTPTFTDGLPMRLAGVARALTWSSTLGLYFVPATTAAQSGFAAAVGAPITVTIQLAACNGYNAVKAVKAFTVAVTGGSTGLTISSSTGYATTAALGQAQVTFTSSVARMTTVSLGVADSTNATSSIVLSWSAGSGTVSKVVAVAPLPTAQGLPVDAGGIVVMLAAADASGYPIPNAYASGILTPGSPTVSLSYTGVFSTAAGAGYFKYLATSTLPQTTTLSFSSLLPTGVTGADISITFTSGSLAAFKIVGASNPINGALNAAVSINVLAQDMYGNTVTSYNSGIKVAVVGTVNTPTLSSSTGVLTCSSGVCAFTITSTAQQQVLLTLVDSSSTGANVFSSSRMQFLTSPCAPGYVADGHYAFANSATNVLGFSNPGDLVNLNAQSFSIAAWVRVTSGTLQSMFSTGATTWTSTKSMRVGYDVVSSTTVRCLSATASVWE